MTSRRRSILIVDDEQVIIDLLTTDLTERGYRCTTALSAEQALIKLAKQHFDVILLDIKLPGKSGMEALSTISSNYPDIAIIMMTGIHEIDIAVEAMKLGASDYITKPFDLERIDVSLRTTMTNRKFSLVRTQIDAIAQGVQARLSGSDLSKVIIETVQLARQLGISETDIQKWASEKENIMFILEEKSKSSLSEGNSWGQRTELRKHKCLD
jgi:two-component system response regulator AtoC